MTRTRRLSARSLYLLPALLFLATPMPTRADWVPGTWMLQAVGRMMNAVLEASEKSEFGYDDGVSLMAAFLEPRDEITFIRYLDKGQTYIIAGGGDDDVRDLDLEVYDDDGRVIARDDKDDNQPVVRFTASYSGKCTIRLKLYAAKRPAFCVASVLRQGGWTVPRENLIKAAGGLLGLANNLDRNLKEDVSFHAGSNQWAMYGGIIRKGEDLQINNIGLGTGRRVVMSAGDTQARDIDLFVRVGKDEASDTQNDATPIVDLNARNVTTASVQIKNVDSGGPCLILTAILQLR